MSTLLILGNFWIIKLINGIFLRGSHVVCHWTSSSDGELIPSFACPEWMWLCLVLSHQVMSNFFVTPWTVSRQAPLPIGFPKQEWILEWVTTSSSRGSSWPRDGTQVSCIWWRILYHWATREALGSVPLSSTLTIVSIISLGVLPCWSHLISHLILKFYRWKARGSDRDCDLSKVI